MIIVTGSRGFIGERLVPLLKDVRHVNRKDGIDFSDIPDKYFNDVESIYHLAGYLGNEKEVHEKYILGTAHLLEKARKHDVTNFILSSSSAVYGQARYIPIDEKHPLDPINIYGTYKVEIEKISGDFCERYGIRYTCLRIFNVFGKNDRKSAIARFLEAACQGEKIIINGSGEQSRDFIHVSDVAKAFLVLTGKSGTFNIGSGRELTMNYIAQLVKNKYPGIEIVHRESKTQEIKRSVADISSAKKFGFRPGIKVEDFISSY